MRLRTSRFVAGFTCLGLVLIPLALGRFEMSDFTVRFPAVVLLMIDAGLTLQFAVFYAASVWPEQERIPLRLFRPVYAWAAAGGYYLMATWTIMAIIARPDGPVNPAIAVIFMSGYALIAVWKTTLLRLVLRAISKLHG